MGTVSSDMWLTLIDSDHTWRSDSTTRLSELYRYHEAGTGQNTVQWEFTGLADGTYEVQTDWLSNEALTDQGRKSPAHAAKYTIYNETTQLGAPVTVDQRGFPQDVVSVPDDPDSFEGSGQAWKRLGVFTITGGTLRVVLSDDPGGGDFVVAGRVRLVPVAVASLLVDINHDGHLDVVEGTQGPAGIFYLGVLTVAVGAGTAGFAVGRRKAA